MRLVYGTFTWAMMWVLYFVLSQVCDREGVTGALLSPTSQPLSALLTLGLLLTLRIACVLLLPAMLVGWIAQRLVKKLLLRKANL
jgi:hypothetical protein